MWAESLSQSHHRPLRPALETSLQGSPWMCSPVLSKVSPSTQTLSWLSTRALRATRAHPSWKQPHPSTGFWGKSKSSASLGTASPVLVTAQVTPPQHPDKAGQIQGVQGTSRDPCLSLRGHHSPGDIQDPEECPALTLLTPRAATEVTVSDKVTTWHRKGWKPRTFPHVPFLCTVPVSLVLTASGICGLWDFM